MLKIKWHLLMLLLALASRSFGQKGMDTDYLNNPNNIYLCALTKYCEDISKTDTKTVYVDASEHVANSYPKSISGLNIIYLDRMGVIRLMKREREATIVAIKELTFDKVKGFSVGVIPFAATYRKRQINLANGGGFVIYFLFDTDGFNYTHTAHFGR